MEENLSPEVSKKERRLDLEHRCRGKQKKKKKKLSMNSKKVHENTRNTSTRAASLLVVGKEVWTLLKQ